MRNKQEGTMINKIWEIVRFALSGLVGVGVYFGVLYSCTEVLGVWYPVSSLIAGAVNIVANFILHKSWTFRSVEQGRTVPQLISYVGLATTLSAVNAVLLLGLVEWSGISYLLVQIPLTVLLSATSYVVSRRIFKGGNRTG